MTCLDLSFASEFSAGQPRSFRDVEEMSERTLRQAPECAAFFAPLQACLHALCCVLWRQTVDDVRAALRPAYAKSKDATDLTAFIPISTGGSLETRYGKDCPIEHFAAGADVDLTLAQLGMASQRDYILGLAASFPVALEPIVWSSVRQSPVRSFFTANEDLSDMTWISKRGDGRGGPGHWMKEIHGQKRQPGTLGHGTLLFNASLNQDKDKIILGARNW